MKFTGFVILVSVDTLLALLCGLTAVTATQGAGDQKTALLVIDVQDCFLPPGGSLAVNDGDHVIAVINKIREDHGDKFSVVVLSQDWHCPDHVSFASQHPGTPAYSVLNLTYNSQGNILDSHPSFTQSFKTYLAKDHYRQLCYGDSVSQTFPYAVECGNSVTAGRVTVPQTMWPDHCIQNVTSGPTSAEFSPMLTIKESDVVVRKGYSCGVDSYSAFYDNGGFRQTELNSILQQHNIDVHGCRHRPGP